MKDITKEEYIALIESKGFEESLDGKKVWGYAPHGTNCLSIKVSDEGAVMYLNNFRLHGGRCEPFNRACALTLMAIADCVDMTTTKVCKF
jgi:hypothetical protein